MLICGRWCLDLFRAPTCIGFAHVAGWLDRGDKFEGDVGDTNDADNTTSNVAENLLAKQKAAKKDVDCGIRSGWF
jgi:hypothetical protein